MSKTTVEAWLGDSKLRVGHLSFHQQGKRSWSSFSYDDLWLTDDKTFSISPDLPLGRNWYTKKARSDLDSVFHLAIQDTEPDGWAKRVIKRDHAKRRRVAIDLNRTDQVEKESLKTSLSELDFLLWVDDESRVGALRFCFPNGPFLRNVPEGTRSAPPFLELASIYQATQAVEKNRESQADLAYLRGKGTSLGGLRPKCTILDEDDNLCVGKFPSVNDERAVTKGEVLCLILAQMAGIDAAKARLVSVQGTPIAIITRFDRVKRRGRIPYLSAASLMQVDPSDDHSYTDLAETIRKFSPDAKKDLHEIWRRAVFNILVTNVDDHLRNQGFLYSGFNQWRLAPAFDVNPFPDKERELKTWLSEDSGPSMSIRQAMLTISRFDLNEKQALNILSTLVKAIQKWRQVAASKQVHMTQPEIEEFEPAFENENLREAIQLLK